MGLMTAQHAEPGSQFLGTARDGISVWCLPTTSFEVLLTSGWCTSSMECRSSSVLKVCTKS